MKPFTLTPLSVFVITLNEAENIVRCLESVRDFADEIIVVDSGSEDNTRELARDCGARVIEQEWLGFVGQKNFALAQCRNEWVFSIDADEEVSPELKIEIEEVRLELGVLWQSESIGGWAMPRRVFYEGRWIKHGDWVPDYVTRLFRREGASYKGGDVHESIEHAGAVRRFTALLFHYSFRDRADHLARIEKYSTLWAQSKHREGRRTGALSPYNRAAFRLVRGLFFKRGLLDGRLGWSIACLNAYEVLCKYRKLRVLNQNEK